MQDLELVKQLCIDQLLVPFEGYAKKLPNGDCMAYPDPGTGGAPYTIGYGSTYDENGTPVQPGDIWTHEKAVMVKAITLNKFLNALMGLSPSIFEENPEKIAAILSFIYNCGTGNYRVSTLKRKVNEKEWEDAASELLKWNKAAGRVLRGLTIRRQAEAKLLLQ